MPCSTRSGATPRIRCAAAYSNSGGQGTLTFAGQQLVVDRFFVSGDFFETLGLSPVIGRLLTPRDDLAGGERVAVISDAIWRQRFGGAVGAIGSTVMLGCQPLTIVGVAPPGFFGIEVGRRFHLTPADPPRWRAHDHGTRPEHPAAAEARHLARGGTELVARRAAADSRGRAVTQIRATASSIVSARSNRSRSIDVPAGTRLEHERLAQKRRRDRRRYDLSDPRLRGARRAWCCLERDAALEPQQDVRATCRDRRARHEVDLGQRSNQSGALTLYPEEPLRRYPDDAGRRVQTPSSRSRQPRRRSAGARSRR